MGKHRAFAVSSGQSNGLTNCFYLFSGRSIQSNENPEILYDAHVYDPSVKTWSVISNGENKNFPFMAGTAFPVGASSIIFSSGANGNMIKKQQLIENRIVQSRDDEIEKEIAQKELIDHLSNHLGFGNTIYCFNTITNKTHKIGTLPGTGQVTTTAIKWGDEFIIPSGEIRPRSSNPFSFEN